MKVIAFNGSPRSNGNTHFAIQTVLNELEKQNIETEIIHIGNKPIHGCLACGACVRNKNEKCIIEKDIVNDCIQKMKDADGIILGSPVYYASLSGAMKCFLERAFYVASVNHGMLRHKVGTSVVAVRRSGGLPTFDQLNNFLHYSEMFIVSSNYWNVIHGRTVGEASLDSEGVQIMEILGKNFAFLLQSLNSSQSNITQPMYSNKIYTNFIR